MGCSSSRYAPTSPVSSPRQASWPPSTSSEDPREEWQRPRPDYRHRFDSSMPQLRPPLPPFVTATRRITGRASPEFQLQKLYLITCSGNEYIAARATPPRTPANEPKLLLWESDTMQLVQIDEVDSDFSPDWAPGLVTSLNARQQRMYLVDPSARISRRWLGEVGMLGWPWACADGYVALPGAGIDRLVVGVDRQRKNVLRHPNDT